MSVADEHRFADVNGVRLQYAISGSGPLMLCVHGFPQCRYTFRHQLAEFARDHAMVAMDLRGYNLSSKPANLWEYGTWQSAEDCRALVEHLGFERYVHVGHDTGGVVGYSMAPHYPDMLERLVILTAAQPGARLRPVGQGAQAGQLAEPPAERSQAREAHHVADLGHVQVGAPEQGLGPLDAAASQIGGGGLPVGRREAACEVVLGVAGRPGHGVQVQRLGVVAVDEVSRAPERGQREQSGLTHARADGQEPQAGISAARPDCSV